MERLPKLDVRAYAAAMREEFEKTMRSVAEAVNDPEGHVIDASEEKVRDALAEFRARAFERAVPMRVDVAEGAFSPGGQSNGKAVAE